MPSGRKPTTKLTLSRARAAFLHTLATTGQITKAAKAAKVERQTAYNWRKTDPDFARAWDEAIELAADMLEDVAIDRAIRPTGYSDGLLTLLLKAHKPEKYRERSEVQVTAALNISERLDKAEERLRGRA